MEHPHWHTTQMIAAGKLGIDTCAMVLHAMLPHRIT